MTLVLYDGPMLSGRSAALERFAWASPGGQYLHPDLHANLSGFAASVAGELRLHRIDAQAGDETLRAALGSLAPEARLRWLSGGELARLAIGCAIACGAERLALDNTLEALDADARAGMLEAVLKPLGRTRDIHIADNAAGDIADCCDRRLNFARPDDAPDLAGALTRFAETASAAAVQAPVLALHNLRFAYPHTRRLLFDRASARLEPGRTYLLRAPNGAGKSTLARLLVGVLRPLGGELLVDGQRFDPSRDARNLFFCAFQNPAQQVFGQSTLAYVERIAAAAERRPTWLGGGGFGAPDELLDEIGLASVKQSEPSALPPAMQKWLTLAAALSARSPWLFFDEPAAGLDAAGRIALGRMFALLRRRGYGTIVVSHDRDRGAFGDTTDIKIENGLLTPCE